MGVGAAPRAPARRGAEGGARARPRLRRGPLRRRPARRGHRRRRRRAGRRRAGARPPQRARGGAAALRPAARSRSRTPASISCGARRCSSTCPTRQGCCRRRGACAHRRPLARHDAVARPPRRALLALARFDAHFDPLGQHLRFYSRSLAGARARLLRFEGVHVERFGGPPGCVRRWSRARASRGWPSARSGATARSAAIKSDAGAALRVEEVGGPEASSASRVVDHREPVAAQPPPRLGVRGLEPDRSLQRRSRCACRRGRPRSKASCHSGSTREWVAPPPMRAIGRPRRSRQSKRVDRPSSACAARTGCSAAHASTSATTIRRPPPRRDERAGRGRPGRRASRGEVVRRVRARAQRAAAGDPAGAEQRDDGVARGRTTSSRSASARRTRARSRPA